MSLNNGMRVEPTQKRAKARVDTILEAAHQHYWEVGRDHFNLEGVAAIAGCSVATVYRYFKDRIVLLDAVFPERDRAEVKLTAIYNLRNADIPPAEKWVAVEYILQSE